MTLTYNTRIVDPIHGIITLTEVERKIIDSPAFQRLLNVQQLGFAYAVFPGAAYSRFSHCIGVCHVMGRLLDAIKPHINDTERQLYRLAALLHDVGHYPYSHATERAIDDFYKQQMTEGGGENVEAAFDHEDMGAAIVGNDPDIAQALRFGRLSVEALNSVYTKHDPAAMENLLSSDLDADRIDYLRRTAYHTGLPYGTVDLEYLLREVSLDSQRYVCWNERALAATDHLQLCRFFDYQQVVHHKTVVGLEWCLGDIIQELLKQKMLKCSRQDMIDAVKSGKWSEFDDSSMFEKIKQLRGSTGDSSMRLKCDVLLKRHTPKMVGHTEFVAHNSFRKPFERLRQRVRDMLPRWADEFGVPETLWHLWAKKVTLTSYEGADADTLDLSGVEAQAEVAEVVRVRLPSGKSIPTIMHPLSLMHSLHKLVKFSLRAYVILEPRNMEKRDPIERRIQADIDRLSHEVFGASWAKLTLGYEPPRQTSLLEQ